MSERIAMSVTVYQQDGSWFAQIPGQDPIGPYENSDEAISAVAEVASKSYEDIVRKALGL